MDVSFQIIVFGICPGVGLLDHMTTLFFFFGHTKGLWDFRSPTKDQIWALGSEDTRVLTTGPPGKSLFLVL